jgi:hypothetical protein
MLGSSVPQSPTDLEIKTFGMQRIHSCWVFLSPNPQLTEIKTVGVAQDTAAAGYSSVPQSPTDLEIKTVRVAWDLAAAG